MQKSNIFAAFFGMLKLYVIFTKTTKMEKKQMKSQKKRQAYLSPLTELIQLEAPTVLCASTMRGNSTEGVTTSGFDWI